MIAVGHRIKRVAEAHLSRSSGQCDFGKDRRHRGQATIALAMRAKLAAVMASIQQLARPTAWQAAPDSTQNTGAQAIDAALHRCHQLQAPPHGSSAVFLAGPSGQAKPPNRLTTTDICSRGSSTS